MLTKLYNTRLGKFCIYYTVLHCITLYTLEYTVYEVAEVNSCFHTV